MAFSTFSRLAASVCLGAAGFSGPVLAQTPAQSPVVTPAGPTPVSLPPLQASPIVVRSGEQITLSGPFSTSDRIRAEVGEWGGGALGEVRVSPIGSRNGTSSVSVRLEAGPGAYWLRLDSAGKGHGALTAKVRVVVPGVRHVAGSWLCNGSPVVWQSPEVELATGPAQFVPGLKFGAKAALPSEYAAPELVKWRLLEVPPLSDMAAPHFDFGTLEKTLRAQLAQSHGLYLGWGVPFRPVKTDGAADDPIALVPALAALRGVVQRVAPGSALVLEESVDDRTNLACSDIDLLAPQADAVWLRFAASRDPWPVKVARRNAEDRDHYDLPVLVSADFNGPGAAQFLLRCLASGASGAVLAPGQDVPWQDELEQNPAWLQGAVTLEDAAVSDDWPAGTAMVPLPGKVTGPDSLAAELALAGRIPLLGRLNPAGKSDPESQFVVLDAKTSLDDLAKIKAVIGAGATVVLMGVPDVTNKAMLTALGDLSGATVAPLPEVVAQNLTFVDPWTFGDAVGEKIGVTTAVKLVPHAVAAGAAKPHPGEVSDLVPRFVARLDGDENGLERYAMGKGHLIWLPSVPMPGVDLRHLLAALAGAMGPQLVKVEVGPGTDTVGSGEVLFAVRRSAQGNWYLALFNTGTAAAPLEVTTHFKSELVQNLANEAVVPSSFRGYETDFAVTVPAMGSVVLALGATADSLAHERTSTSLHARLRN